MVLTSCKLKFTVWPGLIRLLWAPTWVGKKICDAVTPTGPTITLVNLKLPLVSLCTC